MVKYYINNLIHFENIISILQAKDRHSKIKQQLNNISIDIITLILYFNILIRI